MSKRQPPEGGERGGELRDVLRMLFRFSGGRRLYVLALSMLVFEAATAVFQPYPLAYLIDFLQGDRRPLGFDVPFLSSPRSATIALLTIGLVVLTMVNSLGDSLAEIYLARGGRELGYNLRATLHAHLQRLSLAFHDQRRTGDMLTRVTSDVTALEDFVVKSVSDLAGSLLVLTGTLAFLFYKSWLVAVIAILIVPLLASISNHYSVRIKTASKRQRAREGDLASAAQEMLTSIRVIQTYGRAAYETERFSRQSQLAKDAALETAGLQARFSWVVAVLEALAISAVVWAGLWLIDRSTITIGTLILFTILIQNMFKPTRKIIREWSTIGKIFASAERIAEVLDREPAVMDEPGAVPAPPFRGEIAFDGVDFAYRADVEDQVVGGPSERVALQGVSFTIAPGEVFALVGHSGAGKSTIAQLIPRLYDPIQGVVRVDGLDIRGLTLDSLRSQIGVVLQDTVLFSGTVAENIAYGRPEATREQVLQAAVRANADAFIRELPEGYDTLLGERASNLSGGQRQRIAIARAFIRDAPILILDEPTTGLDAFATEQVLLGLRSLIEGKTTVIIAHNLNLIRSADRILVVDEGRIVEQGDHDELLAEGGRYSEYYEMQAGPARTDDAGPAPTVVFAPAPNGAEANGADSNGAEANGAEANGAEANGWEVIGTDSYGGEPDELDAPMDGALERLCYEAQLALIERMGGTIPAGDVEALGEVTNFLQRLMLP
jgi:ABC-type multidrug transport system fused ATPase/permease subunit